MIVKNVLLNVIIKGKDKQLIECILPLSLPNETDLSLLKILIGTNIKAYYYNDRKDKIETSGRLKNIHKIIETDINIQIDKSICNQNISAGIFEQIAEVTSGEVAATLAKEYGGIRIYIPKIAKPNHSLAKLIGLEALQTIIKEIGYGHLVIPAKCYRGAGVKSQIIAKLLEQGLSARTIALLANCCERTVWLYKKKQKECLSCSTFISGSYRHTS